MLIVCQMIAYNFIQILITSYPQLCYQQLPRIVANKSAFSFGFYQYSLYKFLIIKYLILLKTTKYSFYGSG
jgi:hypothetical protein